MVLHKVNSHFLILSNWWWRDISHSLFVFWASDVYCPNTSKEPLPNWTQCAESSFRKISLTRKMATYVTLFTMCWSVGGWVGGECGTGRDAFYFIMCMCACTLIAFRVSNRFHNRTNPFVSNRTC